MEEKDTYTAKYLVDLALQGHYLINEEINQAVWRIFRRYGNPGRDRMYTLNPLPQYPSDQEVAAWQESLSGLEQDFERENRRQEQLRQDKYQQRFPWS